MIGRNLSQIYSENIINSPLEQTCKKYVFPGTTNNLIQKEKTLDTHKNFFFKVITQQFLTQTEPKFLTPPLIPAYNTGRIKKIFLDDTEQHPKYFDFPISHTHPSKWGQYRRQITPSKNPQSPPFRKIHQCILTLTPSLKQFKK